MFVPRVRCGGCRVTDAVLPAFVLVGRLDVVESIGEVVEEVVVGPGGVRPAARRVDVPHTTARGWVRRLMARSVQLCVAFAALGVELGAEVGALGEGAAGGAVVALAAAFGAAASLPGWAVLGRWRFASAVSGGRVLAANMNSPYLVVGRRRFMPPVP